MIGARHHIIRALEKLGHGNDRRFRQSEYASAGQVVKSHIVAILIIMILATEQTLLDRFLRSLAVS